MSGIQGGGVLGQRARPRESVMEEISAGWNEARQRQLVKTGAT
jgi:hypothetical protein